MAKQQQPKTSGQRPNQKPNHTRTMQPMKSGGNQSRNIRQEKSPQVQKNGQPYVKKMHARRFYDYSLLFLIIFLTLFGLVMIFQNADGCGDEVAR